MAEKTSSRGSRFSKLFRRSSTTASPAPPPYNPSPSPKEKASPPAPPPPPPPTPPVDQFPDINALSIPQWTWTNAQCQEWLRKFLVTQCGRSVEYAAEKAGKVEGFGANIYLRRFAAWKELLCFEEADGIYASRIGWREIEGVVPEGVGFNHPKKTEK